MLRSPASLQEGALQRPGAKQSASQEGARKNTVEPNKRYVVYVCMYVCMYVYVCVCMYVFVSFPWARGDHTGRSEPVLQVGSQTSLST